MNYEQLSFLDEVGIEASLDALPIYEDEQIVDAAFEHFRATGFPYRKLPVHVCMQEVNKLARSDPSTWIETQLGYQVADTYHPHRFHASAERMQSPFAAFQDDRLLRHALDLRMADAGALHDRLPTTLYVVTGTQACSNFRPGFAMYIYRRFCKEGDTVLDTSTGYGGRLVGWIASDLQGGYIGIDPNTETYQGNLRLAKELGVADRVTLYCSPAEDMVGELNEVADFAFTSPPYFAKEHYSDEPTQSWIRYKTGEEWRDGFLKKMLLLQYQALRSGSYNVVNIADVKLRGKRWPLIQWTIDAAVEAGFTHEDTERFALTKRMGAGHDSGEVSAEPVLIFHKA